jgi:hypothetical protein
MAATSDQIDQQRRVVQAFQSDVRLLLDQLSHLQQRVDSYNRLGLSSDAVLDPTAVNGTGTSVADYRAAIGSITNMLALLPNGAFAANLEKVAR